MKNAPTKLISACFGSYSNHYIYNGPQSGEGYSDSQVIEAPNEFIKAEYQSK